MAFMKKLETHLQVGMDIIVRVFGIKYSGKVIEMDFVNPQDSCIIIDSEDGQRHLLPVSNNSCVSFELAEQEDEDEVDLTYDEMDIIQLKKDATEKGLEFRKNIKPKQIRNLLIYNDEQIELKRNKKEEKRAKKKARLEKRAKRKKE